MKATSWVLNVLMALFGAALYLWAGVEWSQSAWARAGLKFDQGWLLIAILISQVTTIRLAGARLGRRRWAQILLTCLGAFALEAVTDRFFVGFTRQPSRHGLIRFASFAQIFLIYVLSWIVLFPYEQFIGSPPEHRPPWPVLVRITGAAIALAVVSGTIWSLRTTSPDAMTPSVTGFRGQPSLSTRISRSESFTR